jgi:uncharacterized protein YndB with AHSA1/START domain
MFKKISPKVSVQANISANTKKVWDYYTNPDHITRWNFASDDWHCPKAENDMRVGGKYSSRMEAKAFFQINGCPNRDSHMQSQIK